MHVKAIACRAVTSDFFINIKWNVFSDSFVLHMSFLYSQYFIIRKNIFCGDLTNILAETKTLAVTGSSGADGEGTTACRVSVSVAAFKENADVAATSKVVTDETRCDGSVTVDAVTDNVTAGTAPVGMGSNTCNVVAENEASCETMDCEDTPSEAVIEAVTDRS